MQSDGNYSSLAGLPVLHERISIGWTWRLLGIVTSWFIFGGFLCLQPLYSTGLNFRISDGLLTALVIVLLAAGFSFSALILLVCENWEDRLDIICIPCLSTTFTGLLLFIFSFGVSDSYSSSKAAGVVAVTIGVIGTCIYLGLAIFAYKKTRSHPDEVSPPFPLGSLGRNASGDSNGQIESDAYPMEAPVHIIRLPTMTAEEQETRANLASLLYNTNKPLNMTVDAERASEASSRSTFRLQWPGENSPGATPTVSSSASRLRRIMTLSRSTSSASSSTRRMLLAAPAPTPITSSSYYADDRPPAIPEGIEPDVSPELGDRGVRPPRKSESTNPPSVSPPTTQPSFRRPPPRNTPTSDYGGRRMDYYNYQQPRSDRWM